ncbi:sulfotransferase family protein [Pseudomonas sp. J452]|uniref:sulfotransferase family protein n=1 Tax=Pseudomonas sp. J452 TaxID=2898441 RepID=UPI0021AD5430|nr:sulfotransferase family protein [Pseudomonas sp. J452]UUY09840.1 sulfotransferase family protein [Pseudomonas sp. J452]
MDKLLYLHIPKTGGVAFRSVIENAVNSHRILHITNPADLTNYTQAELERFDFIHGHLNISQTANTKSYKKITSLRHPVERCISTYSFWRSLDPNHDQWRPKGIARIHAAHQLSLEDLISVEDFVISGPFSNLQTRLLSGASEEETKLDSKHLQKAISTLRNIDFFALNSRLDESIDMLCFKFGLFRPMLVQRVNSSIHPKQISQKTKSILQEMNHLDLQLLEWAERNFDQQDI